MKNLILGAAKGYGWDVLEPFVASRKKNCPNAKLVLFVEDISDFTRNKLVCAGVTLENFFFDSKFVANNTRWKIFAEYLARADCDNVLIADTRDVIFQGDIFAEFENFSDWLALPTEGDNFRGDQTGDTLNRQWLTEIYGATADKLLDKKIFCDGTVIGSRREVKIFAETLWAHVDEIQSRVNFRIHDQSVANWIIYNELLPVKNFFAIDIDGAILTMGLAGKFFIRGNKILRGEKIPAIAHQYERFEQTAQLADKIFRDKNFRANKSFVDLRSRIEQATSLLHAEKFDDAAKFFIRKFLAEKDFSHVVPALIRLWSVAVTKNFSRPLADLEAAAQIALKSVGNFPALTLKEICRLIGSSVEKNHFVDENFRASLISALTAAKNSLPAAEQERRDFCDELLKNLR